MSFEQLGLRPELLKALKDKGYTEPTPIQAQGIPVILSGRDLLARAQTGTGKTDAFALSMVEMLSHRKGNGRHPRALILTPTRELALQVGECIKTYARRVSLRSTVVFGGVRMEPQIDRLKRGVDILVATPGRLLDHIVQRHVKLSQIEFLVFDEADRMLDLGFSDDITEIIDLAPGERRTMLFSATYTPQVRSLAARMLKDPKQVEVSPRTKAAEPIVQRVHLVAQSAKRALLIHLITKGKWSRVLVFTRTIHGANKLTERLAAKGISAVAMHSSKSQSVRLRTLEEFKKGKIRVLVATDVAARGLDINDLPHVVNYDMPIAAEDYVHRIGRTGRAGKQGIAISLVSRDEKPLLKAVEHLLKLKIPMKRVDGYTEDSTIPDYVMARPGNSSNEKKLDKDLLEMVDKLSEKERRKKQSSKTTKPEKKSDSGKKPKPKSRSARGTEKAGKRQSRSQSRSGKSSKKSKPGGRR